MNVQVLLLFSIAIHVTNSQRVKPEVTIDAAAEQFLVIGNEVKLTCHYNSSPPASEVRWEKDGIVVSRNGTVENGARGNITHFNDSTVQLTVFSSISEDTGNYTCVVINSVGNSSDEALIIIQVVPSPPENVKVISKSSRVVNISWTPGFHGNSEIRNYTVEISTDNQTFVDARCQGLLSGCVISSSFTRASLEGLHPGRTYYIRVFATNKLGSSIASLVVTTTTDEDAPSAPPSNVQGHNTSSTSIFVQWGIVPTADQNGIILNYTVTYKVFPGGSPQTKVVNASMTEATLTGLNEYTNYSVTVFASTIKGDGNVSEPIIVATDEDKPNAPPTNVQVHNTSSTSILVQWDNVPADDQNGIIRSYTVIYTTFTGDSPQSQVVNAPITQATLTGLNEYTNYSITVFASTTKGDGNASKPISVVTNEDKPDGTPQNVTGHNTSSTSISVTWEAVQAELQNGVIIGYNVTYQSLTKNDSGVVRAGANDRQANLTGLKKYVEYNITVAASTVKGEGPPFVLVVRTDQDKPDGAPENVTGHNTSSTSISVSWDAVPVEQQNGIISGYFITYRSLTENDSGTEPAGANDRQKNIGGLREFVDYNITVFASTSKGDGPQSTPVLVVKTDQDKPGGAPQNVRGHNTSSTSIRISWDAVPVEHQNGIITYYTITYQSQTENHHRTATAGPYDLQMNITGLKEFVDYNITVFASTVKGDGPSSTPVLVVTTDQDRPSGFPLNLRPVDTTFSGILVAWNEVQSSDRNGIILSYTVRFQAIVGVNATINATTVASRLLQANLTSLKNDTKYNISVLASTIKGDGPYSNSVFVTTNQKKPGAAPQNVQGRSTSSTEILVQWDEVPKDKQHGEILHYTVIYRKTEGGEQKTSRFNSRNANLTGLAAYTFYNISVVAATVKGDGPASSEITVRTDEDKPGAPPHKVQGRYTSSTEISVQWDEVPKDKQHGKIVHYTVIYRKTEGGEQKTIRVNSRNVKLTGLTAYTFYSINVTAATVKGDGPASSAITVRTDEDRPSAAPLLSNVTVLNSTSVLMKWERVPKESRNGLITKYSIYYRDEVKKTKSMIIVKPPDKTAVINGLRQKAEYSFWIVAATSKGNGPPSNMTKATTDAVPTNLPPADNAIGAKQVSVKFVNKRALSDGSPVRYFRMIVIMLPKGTVPGNSADEKYQNVTLVYNDQVEGEPYITAEFEREESRTTFTVGDGKYYSRSGITDAKRKRRASSSAIKYLNGKLKENTEYAVIQRSFANDDNYESEGFIQFTTKKEMEPTQSKPLTLIIVPVVVVIVILLIVGAGVIVWRRRSRQSDNIRCSEITKKSSRQEQIEMSGNSHLSTSGSYYNSIQLHDELNSGERPTTRGQDTYDDVHSEEATCYNNVTSIQENAYQDLKNETLYQSLNVNTQADYENVGQYRFQYDDYYQPLNTTKEHFYGGQSTSTAGRRK